MLFWFGLVWFVLFFVRFVDHFVCLIGRFGDVLGPSPVSASVSVSACGVVWCRVVSCGVVLCGLVCERKSVCVVRCSAVCV